MAGKIALITGVTGQDGAYLASLLLEKGYEVHGVKRRSSSFNTGRIEEIYQDPHVENARFRLHYGDMTDATGMMDPWILSRGKWKKALAKLGYERASWRDARAFHALTADEAADIRTATGRGREGAQDIAVIPNAVEPSLRPPAGDVEGRAVPAPILGYLGRIHPKKNLGALIEGWRLARDVLAPSGARLAIAGWGDESHVAELNAALARDSGGDIAFLGPLFGADKAAFIDAARYICLPSHSEGLPMAILEAWAAGTPTIMSRHCHLPEGYAAGAATDCGTDPHAIAAALRLAFAKSDADWRQMSGAASRLARERFAPEVVARDWHALYTRLLSGDPT